MSTRVSRKSGVGMMVVLLSVTLVAGETAAQPVAQSGTRPAPRTVEEVVRRFEDALGGRQALSRHRSRHVVRVTRIRLVDTLPEAESRSESFTLAPDKVLLRMGMGPATVELGFDGVTGWTRSEFTGAERLDSAQAAELRRLADPVRRYDVGEAELLGPRPFEGRAAVAIRWTADTAVVNTDYYDAETGLMLGTDSEPRGAGSATRTRHEDYQWVDGERSAMTTTISSNGRVFATTRVTAVKYDPLDAKVFTPPASLAKTRPAPAGQTINQPEEQ